MKREKFNALQRGDLIRHFNGNSYVVIDSNGRGRVTVARTIDAMNPDEWERVADDDDPRFRKPSTPEPEAGFGMGEPESTPPAAVPADCAGAGVLHIPKRWRTSTTISYTTTTNPAEPLARLILQSASQSASPADVFRDAQRRLADLGQPVFRTADFVPVESYDDYVKRVLDPARGSYSKTVGVESWGDWNNARIVRTANGPVPASLFEPEHKVVGRFVNGRFVATEDSTPVEPDALDRLNDDLDELERERELTGNTTTTSTTTTTEPAVRLGRRAFDALRGPFDASARPDEPFDCWIWSPVLETWVVGCGFVIHVGAEQ